MNDYAELLKLNCDNSAFDVTDLCNRVISIYTRERKRQNAIDFLAAYTPATEYFQVNMERCGLELEFAYYAAAQNDLSELIRILRERLKKSPPEEGSGSFVSQKTLTRLLIMRAQACFGLEKTTQARKDLKEVQEQKDLDPDSLMRIAEILIKEGLYAPAVELLENTMGTVGKQASFYDLYSLALSRLGKKEAAARAFKTSQELRKPELEIG